MKKLLYIITLATIIILILFTLLRPKPRYVYAVTEKVNPGYGRNEWDLWCWREYSNGHINKKYIGHFTESTLGTVPDHIETSLCR